MEEGERAGRQRRDKKKFSPQNNILASSKNNNAFVFERRDCSLKCGLKKKKEKKSNNYSNNYTENSLILIRTQMKLCKLLKLTAKNKSSCE